LLAIETVRQREVNVDLATVGRGRKVIDARISGDGRAGQDQERDSEGEGAHGVAFLPHVA